MEGRRDGECRRMHWSIVAAPSATFDHASGQNSPAGRHFHSSSAERVPHLAVPASCVGKLCRLANRKTVCIAIKQGDIDSGQKREWQNSCRGVIRTAISCFSISGCAAADFQNKATATSFAQVATTRLRNHARITQ